MKVTSYIRIGDKRVKFDELTQVEKQECVCKLNMQAIKAVGEYMPSPEWFESHPEHKEYWEKIVVL